VGKTCTPVEVLQPKCLNVSPEVFVEALSGARVLDVTHRGKWILVETTQGWLLLNLGMGGEILLATHDTLPEKHRLIFDFDDGECLAVNFWWFGYAHYVRPGELDDHALTAKLGPNALDLTVEDLQAMLKGRRGRIKSFLLDQSNLAGIGNAYIHDILFLARLHPLRPVDTLTEAEIDTLAQAIRGGLQPSIDKGGSFYEVDSTGKRAALRWTTSALGTKKTNPAQSAARRLKRSRPGAPQVLFVPNAKRSICLDFVSSQKRDSSHLSMASFS
jgi:formamidopyrimidine-DNA glycosylase